MIHHLSDIRHYRRDLFGGDGAAEAFERTLGEAAKRFGWRIHAVMSNHFHLAVELTEPNLSEGDEVAAGVVDPAIRRTSAFDRPPDNLLFFGT